MLRWIPFFLLCSNLFALEVTMTSAKENFQDYSTLHIKEKDKFICEATKDDFDETRKIICAFTKEPTQKFRILQNNFFEVNTMLKNETFFLIITPKYKMKLFPMIFTLSKEDAVYDASVKISDHWMVVGYKDVLPYIKNEKVSDTAINFPFSLKKEMFPSVGGLDIKGNPIHLQKVQDVTDYLQIKKLYQAQRYPEALSLIDNVIKDYPDTLFMSELLLYRIRVFNQMDEYDSVISSSKTYLKDYSSDENVPEVLCLTARAYGKTGIETDADYFYDRLFTEHDTSPFTQWGYIYRAEMLEDAGGTSKALEFYKKALEETQDVTIAVTAAYNLAKYKVSYANAKEAAIYVEKILTAKPSFFKEELATSMIMIDNFLQENDFLTASLIAKALLDEMNGGEENYEELLKNSALWLCKTDRKKDALDALNTYLKRYKEGGYIEEVQIAKDALFFDVSDKIDVNVTEKLAEYDKLIATYKDDTIGDKALYEKAKLLLQNQRYSDVLGVKQALLDLDTEIYPNIQNVLKDSAIGVMKNALKQKECQEVLTISYDYNITLSSDWDEGLYDCFMKGADYPAAKKIASNNIKATDLEERKKWLYRYIKVDFSTGNYSELLDASKDLLTLIEDEKDSPYKDIYRILFDTYTRLENKTKMLESIYKLQEIYGIDVTDIDRYIAVLAIGSDTKDDNIIIKYGMQVMDIQTASNSFAQSPFVEFTLYQAYRSKEEFRKALDIIKSLDARELNKEQRARQKYLLGSIYTKLWMDDEAKQAYQEAINIDPTSAWAKLAQDANKI